MRQWNFEAPHQNNKIGCGQAPHVAKIWLPYNAQQLTSQRITKTKGTDISPERKMELSLKDGQTLWARTQYREDSRVTGKRVRIPLCVVEKRVNRTLPFIHNLECSR